MQEKENVGRFTGAQKAAAVLLSLSEDNSTKIFSMMADDEVKEISSAMSSLGSIKQEFIDQLLMEFSNEISNAVSFVGNVDTTERMLSKFMEGEKVKALMEDIRGPAGRNTWDKLGNVNEDVLASYLRHEHPQTVSLIVSKMLPGHAARVLSALPDEFSFDIITRVLNMGSVRKEVIDNVEKTLRSEFIGTLTKSQVRDSNAMMAEIFNNFDRVNESKFMGMLENNDPEGAEKIKSLMFTFDDLMKIDAAGIQTLLRNIDKNKLAIALKGANENVRDLFIDNMSQRAAKIMQEDMEAMGPVRLRDVDEAQGEIVNVAKEMAGRGEINISEDGAADEFVY